VVSYSPLDKQSADASEEASGEGRGVLRNISIEVVNYILISSIFRTIHSYLFTYKSS
jgi:hypothetical protein